MDGQRDDNGSARWAGWIGFALFVCMPILILVTMLLGLTSITTLLMLLVTIGFFGSLGVAGVRLILRTGEQNGWTAAFYFVTGCGLLYFVYLVVRSALGSS